MRKAIAGDEGNRDSSNHHKEPESKTVREIMRYHVSQEPRRFPKEAPEAKASHR